MVMLHASTGVPYSTGTPPNEIKLSYRWRERALRNIENVFHKFKLSLRGQRLAGAHKI